MDIQALTTNCTRTEFVGTSILNTIGLAIAGIDDALLEKMNVGTRYHAIGVFSSRTGASGQLTAIDDAIKATNAELLSVELPRDTQGAGGHGNYIVIGADSIEDVRQAIKIGLELTNKYAGEVYTSEAGHLELAYSASAGPVLTKVFNAKPGQALGFMAGCPAAIGLVMADAAVKSGDVEIVTYMTPNHGTSHTNEVIIAFSGNASDVKEALLTGREVGLELLTAMGSKPESLATPYL